MQVLKLSDNYSEILSTPKSAGYFERFCNDFYFCINQSFEQIYATSSNLSWTSAKDFKYFCQNVHIPCSMVDVEQYFRPGMCDGAFLTREYSYDAQILKNWLLGKLSKLSNVKIVYNHFPQIIRRLGGVWRVTAQELEAESVEECCLLTCSSWLAQPAFL